MTPKDARTPFFVAAHHRSGSNFLNDLLQAHPDVECMNEPLSMHTDFFRRCDLEPWTEADFEPDSLHPKLAGYEELRGFLCELRSHLLKSHAQRIVGFKETVLFGKLGWLRAFMPGVKIVLLRRDPRAIVSSALRSGLMEFWQYRELVPPAFARLWPHYRSRVVGNEAAAAELAAMSVVVRDAIAERTLEGLEHREVDLDDLMRRPAENLARVASFLGIEPHPDQFAFFDKRRAVSRGGAFSSFRAQDDVRGGWRTHLNDAQLRAVEDVLQATGFTHNKAMLRGHHDGRGDSRLC